MGGFAWVTLVTNDSYSLGALVLAHSLRRVNTAHQLVVLVTPTVTEAMKTQLSAVFNLVKVVDVLDSQDTDNLALLARPELGITFTKLHCWRLTEFDKCVFLDADTLVLQNSDELFEREELSAAPDAGWPDCFNSGVFVYKPSNETFKALIEFALRHGSFDGGDQGLLNLFFNDWATKDIKKHLPFVYNMISSATYSYLPAFKQFGEGLKIVHFIGPAKPWLQPFNTESGLVQVSGESQHVRQFVQLWWDTFCTHVHPSLSSEMTWSNLGTGYFLTNPAQSSSQAPTLATGQNCSGPTPFTTHSANPTAVYHVFTPYDPWDELHDHQINNELLQNKGPCTDSAIFNPDQEHIFKPKSVEVERQSIDHCAYEQNNQFDVPSPHLEIGNFFTSSSTHSSHYQWKSIEPSSGDSYGDSGPLRETSSSKQSFSQTCVSAPVVVQSQPPWEPTQSHASVGSLLQLHDTLLPDAGLAGALASVTLGAPLVAEQSALAEHLRRQGWEQGNIDYMGKDSFANIWQKICDTLASGSQPSGVEALTPSTTEPSVSPVAPVAAPVFVSSVEMSPTGPIDTSPPASYAPVSVSKQTVVDSETEAAPKAASSEPATVLPESKSSVTEVIPTEASLTSSAALDTSVPAVPAPGLKSEVSTAQDQAVSTPSTTDTTVSKPIPELSVSPTAALQETLPESLPQPGPPHIASSEPQVLVGSAKEVSTDCQTPQSAEKEIPLPAKLETPVKSDVTLAAVDQSMADKSEKQVPAEETKVSTSDSVRKTETTVNVTDESALKKAEDPKASSIDVAPTVPTPLTPVESNLKMVNVVTTSPVTPVTPTEKVATPPTPSLEKAEDPKASLVDVAPTVPTPLTPVESNLKMGDVVTTSPVTPVPPTEKVATPPPVMKTDTSIPPKQAEKDLTTAETKTVDNLSTVSQLASESTIVTSAIALPAVPIPLTPLEKTTSLPQTGETLATETKTAVETPVLESNNAPSIPESNIPKASDVSNANILTDAPTGELPTKIIQGSGEVQTAADAPLSNLPQTPTVTEPTPPASPPSAPIQAPLLTKVESEVPAVPAVEAGASQPAPATASSEDPPVPPKRKGPSKTSQESKNQKGGKQSKGKK